MERGKMGAREKEIEEGREGREERWEVGSIFKRKIVLRRNRKLTKLSKSAWE